jgi:hypothetical protein
MSNLRLLYKSISICLNEICSLIISGTNFINIKKKILLFFFFCYSNILYVIIWSIDLYSR